MDLIALQKPNILRLREAKIEFDRDTNQVLISYESMFPPERKSIAAVVPSVISSQPIFYVLYNTTTGHVSLLTTLSTFTVSVNTVNINGTTYGITDVVLFKIEKSTVDISSLVNLNTTLTDTVNNIQANVNNLTSLANNLSGTINNQQPLITNLQNTRTALANTVSELYQQVRQKISPLYSRLRVSSSFPSTPNNNDLVWRLDQNKLYKYILTSNQWVEIPWQDIVKASPEWIAGKLRINSSTGKLEISPDGTNWYECIPAVGSSVIELATIDNTNYTYKYWISPGTTVIIRNANHVPIVYTPAVEPFFSGSFWNNYTYDVRTGLRPSNTAISDGDFTLLYIHDSVTTHHVRFSGLYFVPIAESDAYSRWGHFELRILLGQRFLVAGIHQPAYGYYLTAVVCSGTASSTSYWLGTWYAHNGSIFTTEALTLTRRA